MKDKSLMYYGNLCGRWISDPECGFERINESEQEVMPSRRSAGHEMGV